MSLGSASPNNNTGNLIDNNNIFDFFNATTSVAGIDLQSQHRHYDGLQQQDLPDCAAHLHQYRAEICWYPGDRDGWV